MLSDDLQTLYRNTDSVIETMDSFPNDCAVITDDKHIFTYSDGSGVNEYTLISNNYVHTRLIDSAPSFSEVPTGSICLSTEQVQQLPSPYDFMMPVFHILAMFSILLIIMVAYRLIIYPFFRKGV